MTPLFASLVEKIRALCSAPRSRVVQFAWLCGGGVLFLGALPAGLLWLSRFALSSLAPVAPHPFDLALGLAAVLAGLALLLWAVVTFWHAGRGTPVWVAAPQQLVVTGPFRYCRNPIELGAITYWLGFGCLFASLPVGAMMFGFGLVFGSAYHKIIEEKELRLRFGSAYEDYCRRTPFLVPRIIRRRQSQPDP